jgi:hypothetical protein
MSEFISEQSSGIATMPQVLEQKSLEQIFSEQGSTKILRAIF